MLFVFDTTCLGGKLLQHQHWNYRHSIMIATSAIQLSFQVLYNLPVPSQQEQDTANLCPFLTPRTGLHYRTWRSCNTAPTFAVLRFEEWRTRQWLVSCVRSVCALESSTSYNDLFTWSSYLNNLLSMAACVFLSSKYFVTVCRFRFIMW